MPALKNAKHEAFARALAKGETTDAAYVSAGYSRRPFDAPSGFYVYLLIDPRTDRVFYVGKGSGTRALQHQREAMRGVGRNPSKRAAIRAIISSGNSLVIEVLESNLTEAEALRIERTIIHRAKDVLTNASLGTMTARERDAAEARAALASIKPLCVLFRERRDRFRDGVWASVVTDLSRIVQKLEAA